MIATAIVCIYHLYDDDGVSRNGVSIENCLDERVWTVALHQDMTSEISKLIHGPDPNHWCSPHRVGGVSRTLSLFSQLKNHLRIVSLPSDPYLGEEASDSDDACPYRGVVLEGQN